MLLIQLPHVGGKAEDGTNSRGPSTHKADQDEIPDSGFQPSPTLAAAATRA